MHAQAHIQWKLIKDTLNKGTSLMKTLFAGPTTYSCVQIYLRIRDTSLYRTDIWVPMVSVIERFHCTHNGGGLDLGDLML